MCGAVELIGRRRDAPEGAQERRPGGLRATWTVSRARRCSAHACAMGLEGWVEEGNEPLQVRLVQELAEGEEPDLREALNDARAALRPYWDGSIIQGALEVIQPPWSAELKKVFSVKDGAGVCGEHHS